MICPKDGCDYESDSERGVEIHYGHNHEGSMNETKLTCDECGCKFTRRTSQIVGGKDFCSDKCKYLDSRNRVELVCENCDESFVVKKSKSDHRFCSDVCDFEYRTGNKHPNWSGGTGKYRGDWWSKRRKAINRARGTCEHPNCDKHKCDSGRSLQVHHIIPNKFTESETVHKLDNLLVLCTKHHAEVEPAPRLKRPMTN